MKVSRFCSCFKCLFLIVDFLWRTHLPAKCHCMHVSEGLLITYAIAWSCGVVGFEEMLVLSASFYAKFWWRRFSKLTWGAQATPRVFKFSYLRNYCRYFLYICVIKRVKPTLSENKIRFKGIQKMRAQFRVSTNFLTVPRKSLWGQAKKHCHVFLFCPQSPNAPGIAQGRYCPRKSLPKHFPHVVCIIKNHCHAIPANVVGVGTIYWCINAHSCLRYFPKIGSPSLNNLMFYWFVSFLLFIYYTSPKNITLEISSFSQL